MLVYPGGGYNPCLRMLSALGRVVACDVERPLCHYLFIGGMVAAVFTLVRVWPHLLAQETVPWRRLIFAAGAALNAVGLLVIACAPEDVSWFVHNVGCWCAALGGAAILLLRCRRSRADLVWMLGLGGIAVSMGVCLALHAVRVLPFAPCVPTLQKVLIGGFAAWVLWTTRAWATSSERRLARILAVALALMGALVVWHEGPARGDLVRGRAEVQSARPVPGRGAPLCADERAALRFLDHVCGELPPQEEARWWNIGGTQHGLFAKRYNIAFAGYAAAALGMRGDARERAAAGRVLGACIARYLRRDVWAYSMSRSYWGRKPWAPDPCFRENVMYTGHLLHLLALYEAFTGDTRYWTEGFDFVWNETSRIHYDVRKLIDVTVHQMRTGVGGGVRCEPGLLFFPCNNHPHVALRLFAALGHGDWSRDAQRWEDWALRHFRSPLFGGGVLNLVYHVRSGIFYPRGQPGLDGWSLLWYEPWAADRGTACALWRDVARQIDWTVFDRASDACRGIRTCCDPADVPATASASFLAAAARACDDPETAARLERSLDASYLKRADGFYCLDLDPEWRIGATANRIIALAEANGSRFRDIVECVILRPQTRVK